MRGHLVMLEGDQRCERCGFLLHWQQGETLVCMPTEADADDE